MPPMPLVSGSTTPIAMPAATAASTAFPPSWRISRPASAPRWCSAVTMPLRATGSVLLWSHSLWTVGMRAEDSRASPAVSRLPEDGRRLLRCGDLDDHGIQ